MRPDPRDGLAAYTYLWRVLTSRIPYGKSVFSEKWDLLVILDACRVDALQEVKDEYSFISSVDSIRSRGSTSKEWIDNTFTTTYRDVIADTAYITSNGFTHQFEDNDPVDPLDTSEIHGSIIDKNDFFRNMIKERTVSGEFAYFEQVPDVKGKRDAPDELGRPIPSPEVLTDRAIRAGREEQHDRMIVHYMQPHAPYIHAAVDRGRFLEHEQYPFAYLKDDGDRSVVWESYLDNLRFVLDSVERLLNNYQEGIAVITADHGELFGEWGLYSHKYGLPHPKLRRVPWVHATTDDQGEPLPSPEADEYVAAEEQMSVEDRLEALGYR
ncbi:alkaline phosphatase family protein [Halalkalicoccus subterraneus]|uniref:hypothetical protein n=1 Tax=Halalkalicoccus subterraneus TaxID=2675002 RepID=UPI000EFC08B4|nr:hypothetical protein [Halalkalicoccus subterraneus]